MVLKNIIPSGPGRYRVCGRECADGSACQNTVDTPGDTCWIDSHRADDPRVDDGPTDPGEVPLSGAGPSAVQAGATLGKGLGVAVVAYLGLGRLLANILIHATAVALAVALALALDVYRRRALSERKVSD